MIVDRDQDKSEDDEHPLRLTIIPPTKPTKAEEEAAEREKLGVGGSTREGEPGDSDESPEQPPAGEEPGE
ncbi:MAG: hypothetical protein ACRDKV_02815 [Solirubrobacterales bacterium]